MLNICEVMGCSGGPIHNHSIEPMVPRMNETDQLIEQLLKRNRLLEETIRKAYLVLKKHELYDIDIVGEAMDILDEKTWGE